MRTGARQEADRRLEDQLFRVLIEQSLFAIAVLAPDGHTLTVNRAWNELWGTELDHRSDRSVFDDERLAALDVLANIRRAMEGELSVVPEVFYDPAQIGRAGSPRWLRAIFRPMKDDAGAVQALALVFEDISERVATEQARHESEARFRALFENPAIGISVCDVEGRVLEVNAALCDMLGVQPGELERVETFDALTHPDDRARDAALFQELVDGKVDHYRQDHRYVVEDGRLVWGDFSVYLVRDAAGNPRYTVGMVRDITEQKLSEAERERLQDELRQAQKLEAIGRLAGGVAHDFNNMLAAILGYSELLIDGLAEGDPRRRDAEEIGRAAERARVLTRQLLAFARRQVLQLENLDVNDVVSELDKLLRRLIGADIELVTVLSPDVGVVEADRGQLEQVIVNLALNARDAMPGGGKLAIETAAVELREPYLDQYLSLEPGRYVELSVRDTGVGMTDETRSRIFEPFFTTKGAGEGTGLGLATVYGIVEQTGGRIFVQSEPARGTMFRIYLPQSRRAEVPEPGRATYLEPASDALRGSETVLLVEDEEILRALIARILHEHGYQVIEASYGTEALEIWGRQAAEIDLVLADVVMPGMSGVELVDQLVSRGADTPIVLTSGHAGENVLQRERIPPQTSFLQKPFTTQALLRSLRETLDRAAAEDEAAEVGRSEAGA